MLLQILLYTLFFLSAVLLILVIVIQEGKGGGLGDAFGGAGAQTFGVRAGGVNKVTFGLFAALVLFSLLLHWTAGDSNTGSVLNNELNAASSIGAGDGEGSGPDGQ